MKKLLLIPSLLMALPLFSQNLIKNHSLETWILGGIYGNDPVPKEWAGKAVESTENPQDGNKCAELEEYNSIRFKMDEGIQAGEKYKLTYYIYDTNPNRNVNHRLGWKNVNTGTVGTPIYETNTLNESKWMKIERVFTAPNNATGFYLNINTSGSGGSGVLRVDNFSLVKDDGMGVNEVAAQEAKIYAKGSTLYIATSQNGTAKIINLNGQTLRSVSFNGNTEVNIGALPKGVYVVVLETANGVFSKKVMF